MRTQEKYLGDAVYATSDGWMVALTADKGNDNERTIWLEPSVIFALNRYVAEEDPR